MYKNIPTCIIIATQLAYGRTTCINIVH